MRDRPYFADRLRRFAELLCSLRGDEAAVYLKMAAAGNEKKTAYCMDDLELQEDDSDRTKREVPFPSTKERDPPIPGPY